MGGRVRGRVGRREHRGVEGRWEMCMGAAASLGYLVVKRLRQKAGRCDACVCDAWDQADSWGLEGERKERE